MASDHRSPGQRAGLSRERVVAAARALAEREGGNAMTMRRVAAELGVLPNALYSHVEDKTALLDAVLDAVMAEIDGAPRAGEAWEDGYVRVMASTRAVLLARPALVAHFLVRPGRGPNARRLGERCLELLEQGGITGERAAAALQVTLVFTLGWAGFEVGRATESDPAQRRRLSEQVFAGAEGLPRLQAAAAELARAPTGEHFEAGLRWLLAGLAHA
jgi:TetR/AcrR family tetracycline transcriptional repressor